MTFITFIYKIGNNPKTYYGKYNVDYVSDDHEGLDNFVVRPILMRGLNEYRKQKNLPKLKAKIHLGILSFSNNRYIPTFSSKKEIKTVDFYCDYDEKIYMNGKQIHIPNGGG